jgi:transglutaminase-like putative cysteine protease
VRYETTLEPIRLALIPALEATPDIDDAAPHIDGWTLRMRPDLQWQTDRIVTERLRFSARAWPRFEHGQRLPEDELQDLVQLPQGYNPRVLAWAEAFKRTPELSGADARRLANAVLAHVRSTGYTYTLTPGTYGRDGVDEFWLDRRSGFCEHFATAFVVVMRAMGVPARVVTGYQGADPRPTDGYFVVRQSHAHAWAEYWMPGRGWQRADPTAAVAPDRVVRSLSLTPDAGLVANALRTVNPELLAELRAGWEAVNNRWNQWVLNYSRTQQFDLLQRLGVRTPDWQDLGMLLIGLLSTGALAGAAWAFWDRRRQDPWQKLQHKVREALATLGIAARPHQPPRQLASLVRQRFASRSHPLAVELDDLDRARYGRNARRRPDPEWWRRFSLEVYRLRRNG